MLMTQRAFSSQRSISDIKLRNVITDIFRDYFKIGIFCWPSLTREPSLKKTFDLFSINYCSGSTTESSISLNFHVYSFI